MKMTDSTLNHIATAEAYYEAISNKDLNGVAKTLHPQVELFGPLATLNGKQSVVDAAKGYMSFVRTISVKTRFSAGQQVMLTYDADFGEPIGLCRTAVLMTFADGLIQRIELFFDASPFRNN